MNKNIKSELEKLSASTFYIEEIEEIEGTLEYKNEKIDNINMYILSMGMSSDYEDAILEGANLVRVGSSLFGARIY